MIVANVADSHNDEYYTPRYAIEPILKYVKPQSTIWCPFDTEDSNFVKVFRENGHTIIATHIWNGQDFFEIAPPKCDYVISNPPYSCKNKVFERLFSLGIPFAMLVGVAGLFESQQRFNMFKNNSFEIMYLNLRVSFLNSYGEKCPSINPPYPSAYVCRDVLNKQIAFERIEKRSV
jgi:hypothetical protein